MFNIELFSEEMFNFMVENLEEKDGVYSLDDKALSIVVNNFGRLDMENRAEVFYSVMTRLHEAGYTFVEGFLYNHEDTVTRH